MPARRPTPKTMGKPSRLRKGFARVGNRVKRVWNHKIGRWVLVGVTGTALVAGGLAVKERVKPLKNGKPPVVHVTPLKHADLSQYKVEQLHPEHLVEVIGGKHHGIIGNFESDPTKRRKFVHSVARQWIESLDGKPDAQDPQARLRGFRGLSASAVVNLSEVAAEISPDLSPREVAGYMLTAQRLYEQSKTMHAGSSGPAKVFWRDQLLRRSLKTNAPEWRVIGFFDRLDKAGHRVTISEIYHELGLK